MKMEAYAPNPNTNSESNIPATMPEVTSSLFAADEVMNFFKGKRPYNEGPSDVHHNASLNKRACLNPMESSLSIPNIDEFMKVSSKVFSEQFCHLQSCVPPHLLQNFSDLSAREELYVDAQSTMFNLVRDFNRLRQKSIALANPPAPSGSDQAKIALLEEDNSRLSAQLGVAVNAHMQSEERVAALSEKLKAAEAQISCLDSMFTDFVTTQEVWGAKHDAVKAEYDCLRKGLPEIVRHVLDCRAVEERFGAAMVAARAYERTLFWNVICQHMYVPQTIPPKIAELLHDDAPQKCDQALASLVNIPIPRLEELVNDINVSAQQIVNDKFT